jgi:hypothetical protein
MQNAMQVMFSSNFFFVLPVTSNIWRMNGVLNVNKKLIAQLREKSRDEPFKPN